MRKIVTSAMLLLMLGCATGNKYVEGTHIALGAYVPYESNLYGVELIQYLKERQLYINEPVNCEEED